jgi:AAA family ATP:ADP antiporter
MFLYTLTASFLYFQQAEIIGSHFTNRAARTSVFASIDLAANLVTVVGQLLLTSRIIGWLAIGGTLAVLPAVCVAGFSVLGTIPSVGFLIAFQVVRRAADYTLTRPARETLYTVLKREDKYKSKNFIDTFVYRVGDQTGAWGYAGLALVGLGLKTIAWVAVGLSILWFGIALWLGRRQEEKAES